MSPLTVVLFAFDCHAVFRRAGKVSLYDFAKHGLLPGSLGLFFLGLALGLAALRITRTARLGKCILTVLIAGYWAMSMPVGAWLLGRLVSMGYTPLIEQSVLANVQAIVVLDGGSMRFRVDDIEFAVVLRPSAVRALEAVRLYRWIQPSLVVVSGGAYVPVGKLPEAGAMREVLIAAGVPADHVVLDSMSRNTREHASGISAILRARGVTRFALVTSSVHMRRAVRAFSAMEVQAIPAPAPLENPGAFPWWPSTAALERSQEAWHEIFGLLRDIVR